MSVTDTEINNALAALRQYPRLPDWVPPGADDLNDIANASRVKQEVASPTMPLPVVYGRDRVPGKIAVVHVDDTNGFLYLLITFAEPCTAIDRVFVEGKAVDHATEGLLAKGGAIETYPSGGGPSPLLVSVIASYADTPSACYVVLKLPKEEYRGFPRVEAIIRGKAVYDPRTTLTAYSSNPALCFADIAVGAGWGVVWSSVEIAADFDDEDVQGAGFPRRSIGLTLADPRPAEEWAKVFRVYTGCFIVWENGLIRLIPDIEQALPADLARTFTADDIVAESVRMTRRNPSSFPTTVIVEYKDSSNDDEWRTERAVVEMPGVASPRSSRVSLPGIHNYAQAYREAHERLNKFYADLAVSLTVFDEGLELQIGSIVRVIHPLGLDNYFRVQSLSNDQGRWALKLLEYNGDVYSDAVPTLPVRYIPSTGSPSSPVTFTNTVFGLTDGDTVVSTKKYIGEDTQRHYRSRWGIRTAMSADASTVVVFDCSPCPTCEHDIDPGAKLHIYTNADNYTAVQKTIDVGHLVINENDWVQNLDISDNGDVIVIGHYSTSELEPEQLSVFHGANWESLTVLPYPAGIATNAVPYGCVAVSGGGTVIAAVARWYDPDLVQFLQEIWVYHGPNWGTTTRISQPDPLLYNGEFGYYLDLDYLGSTLVVSDFKWGGGGGTEGNGAIQVYNGTSWGTRTTLTPTSIKAGCRAFFPSGLKISADGHVIACTSIETNESTILDEVGAVYIFRGANWGTVYKEEYDITFPSGEYWPFEFYNCMSISLSYTGARVFSGHGGNTTGEIWQFDYEGGTYSRTYRWTGTTVLADFAKAGAYLDDIGFYFGQYGVHTSSDGTVLLTAGVDFPHYLSEVGEYRLPVVLIDMDVTIPVAGVSPTVTITGVDGLSGGGDLTANREITLAINGLPLTSDVNIGSDVVAVFKTSDTNHYKMALIDLPGTKATVVNAASTYTLAATDLYVRIDSSTAVDCVVPSNGTVPIDVGRLITVRQVGAGQVTLAPANGVTLNYALSLRTRAQHSTLSLIKVATNEWDVVGDAE